MPQIEYAFLADAAETNPGHKFAVIGGGVTRIGGPSFPLQHPHIALVVGLGMAADEVHVPHQFGMQLLDPDGVQVAGADGALTAHGSEDGREAIVTFSIDLWNVVFPQPGDYAFRITVDGAEAKRLALVLVRTPPGVAGGPTGPVPGPVPGPRPPIQ
jgi:hypothetical protein